MERELNIVTLNIPYPPDYGGMIDSYYRIKELSEAGVIIHLHCFEYGRSRNKHLESYCKTVIYYKRRISILNFFSLVPFIIKSRAANELLNNLCSNRYPVLFDGIHTTYFINHHGLQDRKLLLRTHNIEHNYYRSMARHERNPFRKLYYHAEAAKLSRYERGIRSTVKIFTISEADRGFFSGYYKSVFHIPPFHPFERTYSFTGRGDYVLYHGNLSVNANERAVSGIIRNVFSKLPYKFIIAGKNPSSQLLREAKCFSNIETISDPDMTEISRLIKNAHINLLPVAEESGFKIKLLYSLFAGRFVISNSNLIEQCRNDASFVSAYTPDEMIASVQKLMAAEFSVYHIKEREELLSEHFSNKKNAADLITAIFGV